MVYVLYPCSLYRDVSSKKQSDKITQQNKDQNDGTNKQQASLIAK